MSVDDERLILLENLYKLQQEGQLTDVTIVINNEEFKAHRNILAASSSYFMAMFSNNMLESRSSIVRIYGDEVRAFADILPYLYTTKIAISDDNVMAILDASIYLQIESVVQKCISFLKTIVDVSNYRAICRVAEKYSLYELKVAVYKFICGAIMLVDLIDYSCDVRVIEHIVSLDVPINGSEFDLLHFVLGWFLNGTTSQVKRKDKYAKRILKHIRFEEICQKSIDNVLTNVQKNSYKGMHLKSVLKQMYNSTQSQHLKRDTPSMRGLEPAILRIGGFGHDGLNNQITSSYIDSEKWQFLTEIPTVNQCHYGTAILNNSLYIVGGSFIDLLSETMHPNGFCYNPKDNEWSRIAPMQMDRCRFTLNALNGKLFAVGGATSSCANNEGATNTAECYDNVDDKWRFIESLPQDRQQHAAVAVTYNNTDLLFVSGGLHQRTVIASMFMYNVARKTWTSCAPLLVPRADHFMFSYNNKIYVFGGWYANPCELHRQVTSIDSYDIEMNTWSRVTIIPHPRYHAGVAVHDSKVYVIGGYYREYDFNKNTVVECYNIETDTWTSDIKDKQNFWEHTNVVLHIPHMKQVFFADV